MFEVASIILNSAFWFMKHAVLIAVKPEVRNQMAKPVNKKVTICTYQRV